MVIINGIITFMLTPGHWIENHQFWTGFFNPTYAPSLLFRFCISLALAGIYSLTTASVQRDAALKARIERPERSRTSRTAARNSSSSGGILRSFRARSGLK